MIAQGRRCLLGTADGVASEYGVPEITASHPEGLAQGQIGTDGEAAGECNEGGCGGRKSMESILEKQNEQCVTKGEQWSG